ncbi:hypothetical protein CKO36_01865 [Rhabdochromatium marinum]|nr:hypothetical protein [Rhabdochromatium marinum]
MTREAFLHQGILLSTRAKVANTGLVYNWPSKQGFRHCFAAGGLLSGRQVKTIFGPLLQVAAILCIVLSGQVAGSTAEADGSSHEPVFGPSAETSVEMGERVQAMRPQPNVPTDPVSAALLDRVQAYWAALVEKDFDAAYQYQTPEYRKEHSAKEFAKSFGPYATWYGIEPIKIDYTNDSVAIVGFLLDHSIIDMSLDQPIRFERYIKETWVREGGEWWHQRQSVKMPGMAR